jgi:hypothetical protein
LYSSPSIIRIIKSRRIRWAGQVARMGKRLMHIGYWSESQKEIDHYEDQDLGVWIILKWMRWYGLDWSDSGKGPVDGSREHGNESSDSIQFWELLE